MRRGVSRPHLLLLLESSKLQWRVRGKRGEKIPQEKKKRLETEKLRDEAHTTVSDEGERSEEMEVLKHI